MRCGARGLNKRIGEYEGTQEVYAVLTGVEGVK